MAERKRVFVHIGAPKTGTTYLQRVLYQNQEAMQRAGVLYPTLGGDAHHTSVWDFRNFTSKREFSRDITGHWDTVVKMAQDWDGHATVISSELWVYSKPDEVRRALESFDGLEVHVIYTARDLVRQVPAVWQERMKNQQVVRYDSFLADVLGARKKKMSRGFWNAQDPIRALERWSQDLVEPRHVHVVTAPPSGAPIDTLWRRFASVLGLDADQYPSDVPVANPSMGVTAAELLRRYNLRHGKKLSTMKFRQIVRNNLDDVLATALKDTSKLPLTAAQRDALCDLSEETVTGLRAAGYDVVGNLDDLIPARPESKDWKKPKGRGPSDVTDAEMIDALLDVLHQVLRKQTRLRRKRRRNS